MFQIKVDFKLLFMKQEQKHQLSINNCILKNRYDIHNGHHNDDVPIKDTTVYHPRLHKSNNIFVLLYNLQQYRAKHMQQ